MLPPAWLLVNWLSGIKMSDDKFAILIGFITHYIREYVSETYESISLILTGLLMIGDSIIRLAGANLFIFLIILVVSWEEPGYLAWLGLVFILIGVVYRGIQTFKGISKALYDK